MRKVFKSQKTNTISHESSKYFSVQYFTKPSTHPTTPQLPGGGGGTLLDDAIVCCGILHAFDLRLDAIAVGHHHLEKR